jgi:hypothetical protein
MFNLLFVLIVAAFIAMLAVNVLYRVKILKLYKYMVQNNIEFNSSHFFSSSKMEEEVLSRYPKHREKIVQFVHLIKQSITLASGLILIILIFGYILMKFR